jgi:hypothetical protein
VGAGGSAGTHPYSFLLSLYFFFLLYSFFWFFSFFFFFLLSLSFFFSRNSGVFAVFFYVFLRFVDKLLSKLLTEN